MKITNSKIKKIIQEELLKEREHQIVQAEYQRIARIHRGFKNQTQNEIRLFESKYGRLDEWSVLGAVTALPKFALSMSPMGLMLKHPKVTSLALDIAGLFPGFGEAADLANAMLYISRKEWFMAGLSLISMIPVVGDIVGKGGKLSMMLSKGGGAKGAGWLAKTIKKYMPQIKKGLEGLKDNPKVAEFIDPILQSILEYVGVVEADPNDQKALTATASAAQVEKVQPADPKLVDKVKNATAQAQAIAKTGAKGKTGEKGKTQPQVTPVSTKPATGGGAAYSKPPV